MSTPEIRFQPAVNYDDSLWRAAAEAGVDSSYYDIFGHQHHASREALQALLEALGWDTSNAESLEAARRRRFSESVQAGLPSTAVVSEHDKTIPFSTGSDNEGSVGYQIELEGGGTLSGTLDLGQLPLLETRTLDDQHWSTRRLTLPAELPLGYHLLRTTIDSHTAGESQLIVCPDRAYLPPELAGGGRTAGFNVSLYGLRSRRNWGAGDFTDLRALIDWAHHEVGFSFIGLNPLHALHNRTPYNASPYLPLSMYYKNLLYIDIEAVPEFLQSGCAQQLFHSAKIQDQIARLRNSEFVQYAEVARLKRRFLKVLYREFRRPTTSDERRQAFAAYREKEGDLLAKFALYSALDELLHKQNRNLWTWRDWPAEYHSPESSASQAFARDHPRSIDFYQYIQFVLEEQLAAAQKYARDAGMPIGLYHDLAVATDNFGSDLWIAPDHYVNGARVGAPPDDFSPDGQDWGFPPPNKETHRAQGYRLFRESIRKIVCHGGALRIDHVMRLYRLFWVPPGLPPAAGAYVRDYATDLMHVLALESVRNHNIIVGEDLGTVTDEMRELFTRFGILSYRLFPFERNYQTGAFKQSSTYPRQALVSSSTHDLPTLAGFWQPAQTESRRIEKQRMLDVLHIEHLLPENYPRDASQITSLDGDLHNAIVAFLAQVPSLILLLNQEDFTKETEQQNLPGTTSEYPNWQRKMRVTVEDLTGPASNPYTQMIKHHLMRTGRALSPR